MYKPLADSTLMNMNKKDIIKYLRIAEHNHNVCEEQLNQQYENCLKLIKEERIKAVDEYVNVIVTEFDFVDSDLETFISLGETIKMQ